MTPNLKRLFIKAKEDTYRGDNAHDHLMVLFERHGEALIEALDGAYDIIEEHVPGHTLWLEQAKELLAQLEQEAQP